MRFWQKILFIVVFVFVITLNICLMIFLTQNWSMNLESEIHRAKSEQALIGDNLANNLSNLILYQKNYRDNQSLFDLIHSFSRFYEKQGVEILIFKDGIQFFPLVLDKNTVIFDDKLQIINQNNEHIVQIVSRFTAPYQNLQLVYRRNINNLYEKQQSLSMLVTWISIVASSFLGIVLFIIIRKMTQPLSKLTQISGEIAQGKYEKRVELHTKDEFGDLANSFNHMAAAIEDQIVVLSENILSKQQMIDNLAHELRTPLTSMKGFSQLLLSSNLNEEEQRKALHYINQETDRLQRLAFKLLDMTLMRNQEFITKEIPISQLFNQAIGQCQTSLACKKIIINTDIRTEFVQGDEDLLASFLINAIENACHASNENDHIYLNAYEKDDQIILEIGDQGKGMSSDQIKKAFEPFYRADKSRSREHGGAGLGLSLCQQIAELHHGELKLTSEQGKWTCLKMILPVDNNSNFS